MDRNHVFCQEGDPTTRVNPLDIGPSLTRNAVERQLGAMNSGLYEVGLFRAVGDGRPSDMLPRTWDRETLVQSLFWLRWENSQGRNIFIRPAGEHHLSLVDDLAFAAIRRMKLEGFAPAAVVETSPGNFQAWLSHGEMLEKEVSARAARALAQRFGGDPGAADWRHFGRLAGFTNRKSSRRQDNGLYPFVHLIEGTGIVYPRAGEFVAQLRKEVVNQAEARARLREQSCDFQQIMAKAAILWFRRRRSFYGLESPALHELAEFISLPDGTAELHHCLVNDRLEEFPVSGEAGTERRPHTP